MMPFVVLIIHFYPAFRVLNFNSLMRGLLLIFCKIPILVASSSLIWPCVTSFLAPVFHSLGRKWAYTSLSFHLSQVFWSYLFWIRKFKTKKEQKNRSLIFLFNMRLIKCASFYLDVFLPQKIFCSILRQNFEVRWL